MLSSFLQVCQHVVVGELLMHIHICISVCVCFCVSSALCNYDNMCALAAWIHWATAGCLLPTKQVNSFYAKFSQQAAALFRVFAACRAPLQCAGCKFHWWKYICWRALLNFRMFSHSFYILYMPRFKIQQRDIKWKTAWGSQYGMVLFDSCGNWLNRGRSRLLKILGWVSQSKYPLYIAKKHSWYYIYSISINVFNCLIYKKILRSLSSKIHQHRRIKSDPIFEHFFNRVLWF